MGLVQTSAPATEPITNADTRAFLRITGIHEAPLVTTLIEDARQRCERVTGRALITQTWRLTLSQWPCDRVIRLPKPPLVSVSSITYIDTSGTTQTLAADQYRVDITTEPGTITPAYGVSWPSVRDVTASIAVTFVCGYGAATAVPAGIKERLKNHVAYCFEHRTDRDERYLDTLFEGWFCGEYS